MKTPPDLRNFTAAAADASRTLEQKWTGSGPRYHVVALVVQASEYDEALDDMVEIGPEQTVRVG